MKKYYENRAQWAQKVSSTLHLLFYEGTWASRSRSPDVFQFVESYPVIVIKICEEARLCHLISAHLGASVTSNKTGNPNDSIFIISIIIARQSATTVTKTNPNVFTH